MTDPTRFDLDDRQRAMLAEMGVRVWWPQTPVEAQDASPVSAPVRAPVQTDPVPAVQTPAVADAAVAASTAVPISAPTPAARPVAPRVTPVAAIPAAPAASTTFPALAEGIAQMDWAALQDTAAACTACGLCAQRQQSVFGVGDTEADWLVVGDHPSEDDGTSAEPFVGQSGQLLDNMLKAVGLNRKAQGEGGVYIANNLKCRPPGTRNPSPEELATCAPYLARQVALVQPKVILVMGRFAVQSVLQSTEPLGKLRGQVHSYQGVPVVVTYHPDALLRNPADKAKAWADLVLALQVVRG
jgi:uracil-DNA glycosylase